MREPLSQIRKPRAEGRKKAEARGSKAEGVPPVSYGSEGAKAWDEGLSSGLLLLKDGEAKRPLDLHERTAQFGEAIIRFAKKIPRNSVNVRLIEQLVGAGTSVGANYCEADDAVSGKEFKLRIGTCRKESKEAMFFLRMMAAAQEDLVDEARLLWREAKELNLIFGAIWRKK